MSRSLPPAAVRILRDALTEARDAGITDPAAAAFHAAGALVAAGWYITPLPTRPHPRSNPHDTPS